MLELALNAARAAGDVLRSHYGQAHIIHHKGLRDIATEADYAAEEAVISTIRAGCPDARFISEESYQEQLSLSGSPVWLVDPLDGTSNYAHGLPEFSVSIAMALGGVIQVGVVYEPITDQLFHAERGRGAFLGSQRLQVSNLPMQQALFQIDWPRQPEPRQKMSELLQHVAPLVDCVRSRGSAALGFCAVAAGWAEAYIQFALQPWDVAAGLLILEEAGGKATAPDGSPAQLYQSEWLATNGIIHADCTAVCRATGCPPYPEAGKGT